MTRERAAVEAEGALLRVPTGARLPKVCVKCGAREDIERRRKTLPVSNLGQGGAYVGGAIGAATAASLRGLFQEAPAVGVAVVAGIVVVVGGGAAVLHRTAQKVQIDVPLCPTHYAALARADRHRGVFVTILLGALVSMLAGLAVGNLWWMGGSLLALFVVIGGAWASGMRQAAIPFTSIKADAIHLNVGAELAATIAKRAARRDARRDARLERETSSAA